MTSQKNHIRLAGVADRRLPTITARRLDDSAQEAVGTQGEGFAEPWAESSNRFAVKPWGKLGAAQNDSA
jgi:hypothetical protein